MYFFLSCFAFSLFLPLFYVILKFLCLDFSLSLNVCPLFYFSLIFFFLSSSPLPLFLFSLFLSQYLSISQFLSIYSLSLRFPLNKSFATLFLTFNIAFRGILYLFLPIQVHFKFQFDQFSHCKCIIKRKMLPNVS